MQGCLLPDIDWADSVGARDAGTAGDDERETESLLPDPGSSGSGGAGVNSAGSDPGPNVPDNSDEDPPPMLGRGGVSGGEPGGGGAAGDDGDTELGGSTGMPANGGTGGSPAGTGSQGEGGAAGSGNSGGDSNAGTGSGGVNNNNGGTNNGGTSNGGSGTSGSGTSGSGNAGSNSGPTCTDGEKNGAETGVDCGGGCGLCELGKECTGADQCVTGVCNASNCDPDFTRCCQEPRCPGDQICLPGEERCGDGTLEVCNECGTGYQFVRTCLTCLLSGSEVLCILL